MIRQAIAERRVPATAWESVEKSIEIESNLRAMEAAGLDFQYHVCDVSDNVAVAELLEKIRRAHGPLEGVIHGAGIEKATRFTKKNAAVVDRTVAAKVDGAATLMRLTRDDKLRYFIGFGSISGRWGAIGQTDYAMASDMLAKLVVWYRQQRPNCFATCFHWQPWADIGMAAREETRGADVLQKLDLLPVAEGIEHFFRELTSGCERAEVVITDWKYYKGFYSDLSAKDVEPMRAFDARVRKPTAVPPPVASSVAQRQVMRVVPSTVSPAAHRFAFAGPAIILGDCDDARALAEHLTSIGVQATPLPIAATVDETLGHLQQAFTEQAAPHLFVMTGREPVAATIDDDLSTWQSRRDRGVLLPFAACQKWLELVREANLLDRASLVAVTSLGGDFGFELAVPAPEGGALSGLLKGLYMEFVQPGNSTLRMRVIDAPSDEPSDSLARSIVGELAFESADLEVAYRDGQRHVVRLKVQSIEPPPTAEITRGGTWVITGGARGIAAAVAKELGHRYGLKLHLLGTRPSPPEGGKLLKLSDAELAEMKRSLVRKALAERQPVGTYWEDVRRDLEIERNLHELAAAGVSATYHACDVCDVDALELTLQQIRNVDGPIQGIVHSAGIHGSPTSIEDTSLEMTDALLAVKVDAAYNLMRLTRDDPVRYFVAFGSLSGRFGSMKASAYALVSDYLCKLIGWYRQRRPSCHAVGFHWHPWGEVGMMTRPVSQHTITVFKMQLMSPAEGVQHLIDELRAGAPESEVLVTDFQFVDAFASKEIMLDREPSQPPTARRPLPLIDSELETASGHASIATRLDPVNDVFLREHRLRQKPTLPLVVALEMFAEASSLIADGRSLVAFRDVEIADAVRFFSDEPMEVRTSVEPTDTGLRAKLMSDLRNRRGQLLKKDREHFSATLELGDATTIKASPPPEPHEWFDITYPEADAPMYHGASLRQLRRVAVGDGYAVGQIKIAGGEPLNSKLTNSGRKGEWIVPSATLDACLYACGVYVWATMNGAFAVPHSMAELRLGSPPRAGETTRVHVVPIESGERYAVFDFTLFGDDDRVLLAAHRYRCHVLNDSPMQHSQDQQQRQFS